MNDVLLKQKLSQANRILVNEGLTELGRGHVACLVGEGRILMPAHLHDYGRTVADCRGEDLVTIDFEGRVLEGGYPRSMGEFHFYVEAFKRRKDVKVGAHAHPYYANLLAMTGKEMLMMSRDSFMFSEGIPIFEGLPLYVGNLELGAKLVDKLGNKHCIIHRGHGVFVVGESVEDVIIRMASLERAAKKQFLAYTVGTPQTYDKAEVEKTTSTELYNDADWNYFVSRLQKL
jgi:ribulose-5-phosphate 4-epimerase/fuculose-1-phosphate aldolase